MCWFLIHCARAHLALSVLKLVECTFFSEFSYARTNYIQNFPEIIKPTKKVESLVEAASTKNAALVFKKPPTSLRKTRPQVFNIYVLEAWGENASSERVLDVYGELPHQQQFMIMTPSFQNHSELEFFIFLNQIVQSL